MTLLEIENEVRALLHDELGANNPSPRFTTAKIRARINEGHKDLANSSKVLKSSMVDTLADGIREYAVPENSEVLEIERVEVIIPGTGATNTYPLFPASPQELDYVDRHWKNRSGRASHYYTRGNLIGVFPLPSSAQAGQTIRVEYAEKADVLTDDDDTPRYPDQYHKLLVYFAVEWCKKEDDDLQEASVYNQMFEAGKARMKAEQDTRKGTLYTMKPSSIGGTLGGTSGFGN